MEKRLSRFSPERLYHRSVATGQEGRLARKFRLGVGCMSASRLAANEENGMNRRNAAEHGLMGLAPALAILVTAAFVVGNGSATKAQQWAYYGGDAGGSKYSPLRQVNRENVGRLH